MGLGEKHVVRGKVPNCNSVQRIYQKNPPNSTRLPLCFFFFFSHWWESQREKRGEEGHCIGKPPGFYKNHSKNKSACQMQRKSTGPTKIIVTLPDSLLCGEPLALPGAVGRNNSNKTKTLLPFSTSLNSLFGGYSYKFSFTNVKAGSNFLKGRWLTAPRIWLWAMCHP